MEIKEGYKKTEVGVIPEEWEVYQLGEIGEIIRGASPRPKGDKRYYGGKIPRLMVEDVTRDGKVVFPKVDYLTEEGALKSRPCKKGTLTIVCSGTVGVVSFLGIDACIHDGFLALININCNISDNYIYYHLSSLQAVFNNSATHGGVFTNLTTNGVKELNIPIPPLPEQQAIATALSDIDNLISSMTKLIEKKKNIKQGAMQELLTGKKRLEGFSGEWQVKPLKDLFDFNGGYSASREQLSTEGYCYLHYGDIHGANRTFIDVEKEYIEIPKLDISLSKLTKDKLLSDGDVVFVDASEDDEGTSKHIVVNNPKNISFISGLHTIVSKSKNDLLDKRFRRYCFQSYDIKKQFRFYAVGTKVSGISRGTIAKINLSFPVLKEEQSAIANILSDMDAEIEALEQKLNKYKSIKQGMMQELLTGRIRLLEEVV